MAIQTSSPLLTGPTRLGLRPCMSLTVWLITNYLNVLAGLFRRTITRQVCVPGPVEISYLWVSLGESAIDWSPKHGPRCCGFYLRKRGYSFPVGNVSLGSARTDYFQDVQMRLYRSRSLTTFKLILPINS